MNIFASSNHLAWAALIGGITSAGLNAVIGNYVDIFIRHTQKFNPQTTLTKLILSSIFLGLLLSIIFYSLTMFAFPNARISQTEIITLFTLCFGLGYPLLDMLLALIRNKIFA